MKRLALSVSFQSRPAAALLASILAVGCGDDSSGRNDDGSCGAGLLSGDVVISEIMANPPGPDSGSEWFELYNASAEPVDLAGATLSFEKADGSGNKDHAVVELTIEPGGYVVVGNVLDDDAIRPPHVHYGYGDDLGDMNNSSGRLSVACGTALLDTALYEEPGDSVSKGFDGTRTPDATANDDLAAWCDAQSAYSEDALGTPGVANDPCFGSSPTTCVDEGAERDVVPPQPGDLVISEVMPNPSAVGDNEGEWFEVYAVNGVDLNGLELGKPGDEIESTVGGTTCISVQSGDYVLFSRQSDPVVNGGLPEGGHPFTFSLSNSNAGLFIGWGGEVLDEVTWSTSSDGASRNLDPDRFDADANDDEGGWCAATQPYGDGDLGTPAAPNTECMIAPPAGQCVQDGELRDTVPPAAGDLVITEIMPNPAAVGDTEGEWFEVRAQAAFDLNGLELGREEVEDVVEVEDCISVQPGDHLIFAKNPDMATNGALPRVDAEFGFSMVNSDGRLFVGYEGEVLDEVVWTTSGSGIATSLDPDQTTVDGNDDEANWCEATAPYGDGDLGTPGEENPACGFTPPGTCDDDGTPREPVAPGPGDLVITEIMPNPDAVTDANGEWFEVLVTAEVDLNGLEIGRAEGDPDHTLPAGGPCLEAGAGTRIVLAKNADSGTNGGLDPVFATSGALNLVNTDGTLYVGYDGATLDAVTWTSSTAGASLSLDPGSEDPTANDDEGNFCDATTAYGDGDLGTPGDTNDACE